MTDILQKAEKYWDKTGFTDEAVAVELFPQMVDEVKRLRANIDRALQELGIEVEGETPSQFNNRIAWCLHGHDANGNPPPPIGSSKQEWHG